MASLDTITDYATTVPKLHQRFAAARLQAAWDILAEPSGGTAPRAAWRLKIFKDYRRDLDQEYLWFLSHSSVQAAGEGITDAALLAATKSFIDAWAAVNWS